MVLFVKLKAIFKEYQSAMYDAVTSVGERLDDVSEAALDACTIPDLLLDCVACTHPAPGVFAVTAFTAHAEDVVFTHSFPLASLVLLLRLTA